jgi:hypothetical protein
VEPAPHLDRARVGRRSKRWACAADDSHSTGTRNSNRTGTDASDHRPPAAPPKHNSSRVPRPSLSLDGTPLFKPAAPSPRFAPPRIVVGQRSTFVHDSIGASSARSSHTGRHRSAWATCSMPWRGNQPVIRAVPQGGGRIA